MALFTAENALEEVGVGIREFKDVDRAKCDLAALHGVDLELMHTSAVEMVVVDLVASQHETVETQVVNKHFL